MVPLAGLLLASSAAANAAEPARADACAAALQRAGCVAGKQCTACATHHEAGLTKAGCFKSGGENAFRQGFCGKEEAAELGGPRQSWSGPMTVPSVAGPGPASILVNGQRHLAQWLAGDGFSWAYEGYGRTPDIQAGPFEDWLVEVGSSAAAGNRVFETVLPQWQLDYNDSADGIANSTRTVFDETLKVCPDAVLILRIHFTPDTKRQYVMDDDDKVKPASHPSKGLHQLLVTPADPEFSKKSAAGLIGLLTKLDQLYPGKIAGIHLFSLYAGCWLQPLPSLHGWSGYSQSFRDNYCAAMKYETNCSLPTTEDRNVLRTGTSSVCGPTPILAAQQTVGFNMKRHDTTSDAILAIAAAIVR